MRILAIDTAFRDGRIGLIENGALTAEESIEAGHLESQTFAAILKLGVQPALGNIDLIALSSGPGSFTGLKIGAMVAKSLSFLQGKPFKGIGTLPWLANSLGPGVILPLIKSHGERYYWALYNVKASCPGEMPWELASPACSTPGEIIEAVQSLGLIDLPKAALPLTDGAMPELPWALSRVEMPLTVLAGMAERAYSIDGSDDPLAFNPIYIGRSQAEEKADEASG
jgi:tRNA threonylcarbamoyl adenosine modification protein YeaZ